MSESAAGRGRPTTAEKLEARLSVDHAKRAAATCCGWHLLAKPKGWRGHVTWCRCGTLLVLREGVWQRG